MKKIPQDAGVVTPHIQRKYMVILTLIVIIAVLSPSYFGDGALWSVWIFLLGLGSAVWGLKSGFRFQRIHRKLRPFIMTRLLQILSLVGLVGIAALAAPQVMESRAFVPYLIYAIVYLSMVWQFFAIFNLAKEAKEKYPDRCEFC